MIDGSHYPIKDELALSAIDRDYQRDSKLGLVKIGALSPSIKIVSKDDWSTSSNVIHFFLIDGDEPIALFDVFPKKISENSVYQTKYSYVNPSHRGQGLGFLFYSFLINNGLTICSDHEHTRDSIALWNRLAKSFTVTYKGEQIQDTSACYDGSRSLLIARAAN